MVAGSILPVAFYKKQLYFLFGKENPMEDSAKGFSDFGGGADKGETPFDAAIREGSEELTGFLGDSKDVRALIKHQGDTYNITINNYHMHLFQIQYDENLPKYYNNTHRFLWKRMDKKMLNESKLFEKIEIGWFTPEQMKTRKSEFREFYQEHIDAILAKIPEIRNFIESKRKIPNKTRRCGF